MAARLKSLITPNSLATKLLARRTKGLKILDGTLLPSGMVAREEFSKKHIPGSQLFDFEESRNKSSPYLNMLPEPQEFAKYVGSLGISNTDHVIVYDNIFDARKIFSAPRLWWMFKVFGHDNVSILDGGLYRWNDSGYGVCSQVIESEATEFEATFRPEMVVGYEDIIRAIKEKDTNLIDSRPSGRFNGAVDEPDKGVIPGHMPGATNLPFTTVRNDISGLFKTEDELKKTFDDAGIDLTKPSIATCSMGVTACSIAFAGHLCDVTIPVYDGSWMEYFSKAPDDIKTFPQSQATPA